MTYLRLAEINEAEDILKFYQKIITTLDNSAFDPKWNEKYPDLIFIEDAISKKELHIFKKQESVIASVVINHELSEEYDNANWIVEAESNETTSIHTFAISPNFRGMGIGRKIFNEIKENALKNNKKSIRLDVIDSNTGAQKVFEKLGFEYIDTIEISHYAVGKEKFHLYEFPLKLEK